MEIYQQFKPDLPQKGRMAHETVHLSFAVEWSEKANPLLYIQKGIQAGYSFAFALH